VPLSGFLREALNNAVTSLGVLKWPFWLAYRGTYIFNEKEFTKSVYWDVSIIAHFLFFIRLHLSHFSRPWIVLYIHTYFIAYQNWPNQVRNRNVYRALSLIKNLVRHFFSTKVKCVDTNLFLVGISGFAMSFFSPKRVSKLSKNMFIH